MPNPITWEEIEALRDRTFFRRRQQQLRDLDDAENFVKTVGFCFAFKAKNSELPCMWHAAAGERNPDYPIHIQQDPHIGLVWNAKDALAAERKVYYGKALKKRPTFISLDYFPAFYRLSGPQHGAEDYAAEYMRGQLSNEAKRIMEALMQQSPMVTADLKMASRLAHPDNRPAFDKAMAELQAKLYIVKIGEFYDPFTFLWDMVERRFAEEIVRSQALTFSSARKSILQQYFKLLYVSNSILIGRLFGWETDEIDEALSSLYEQGTIQPVEIKGEKRAFWAVSDLK